MSLPRADLALAESLCNCGSGFAPIRDGSRCKLYWCRGCRRWVPWCYGAADARPALCDGCAATVKP